MLRSGLFAVLSLAFATAAYAEAGPTIVAPTGKVLVNQGNGFVPATNGLAMSFKDQIMVGKDAVVTLAYAKCSVVLKPGTLLTLPKGDLCGKTPSVVLQNNEAVQIAPVASTDPGGGAACATACDIGLGFVASVAGLATYSTVSKP